LTTDQTRLKVFEFHTQLTTEFRCTLENPKELPKLDFEQGQSPLNENLDGTAGKGTYRETRTHDTTIHTTVKPPVVHETIRPIETEIIDTELTVHRHVHHYVHRIQPVIVSSFEEERLAHDILGQGQPSMGNAMYRESTLHEGNGEMCRLCGADGNLLSHIGSLKRRNNEASSTGACPVCGSDRGVGGVSRDTKGTNGQAVPRGVGDVTGGATVVQDGERSRWGFGANPADRERGIAGGETEGDLTRGVREMKISQ
jgi:hypothetical protein